MPLAGFFFYCKATLGGSQMPWGTMVTPNQQELDFWEALSSAVSAMVYKLTTITQ